MSIDFAGVYFALGFTVLIAVWAIWRSIAMGTDGTKTDSATFFTGKGTLTPSRLFFSIFATTFSAFTVVGLPAMFYAHGVGTFIWMGIGIFLTPLVLWWIGRKIVERTQTSDAGSVIGLVASGYGSPSLLLVLSIVTLAVLFPYLTLQIAGIGKFLLSVSDGNFSYLYGTAFVCILVGAYVSTGGAAADVETDFIQGPILLIGAMALGGILLFKIWGSFHATHASLEAAGLLSLPGPRDYFQPSVIFSFGVLFTFISISTPQVSQRLMGSTNADDLRKISWIYAFVGLIVVALAGLIGLYAAANLDIASPDFVAGDVLRLLARDASGPYLLVYSVVAILFMTAVISAAVSTMDSVLLAVAGIASDNLDGIELNRPKHKRRIVAWVFLIAAFVFADSPPTFIVDLARIQLAGLTALLPCLLGPLFGFDKKLAGWFAFAGGLAPILASQAFGIHFSGIDPGVIGLGTGLVGLVAGNAFSRK